MLYKTKQKTKTNYFFKEQISCDKLNNLFEDNSAIIITDINGVIINTNKIICPFYQLHSDELIGKQLNLLKSDYHSKSFSDEIWKTILKGKIWRGEICDKSFDGSLFWSKTKITPEIDEFGVPQQFIVALFNTTEQKKLENKLNKSIHLLNAIMNTSQDAQIVFENCNGKIAYFNNLAEQYIHKLYNQNIKTGDLFSSIIPAEKKDEFNVLIEQCLLTNSLAYQMNIVNSKGKEYWLDIKMAVIKNEMNQIFVSISMLDITLNKCAELQLKKHNQLLEEAVDQRTSQLLDAFNELQQKNKEVNDSLQYASKIQRAMFASNKTIFKAFSGNMLLFKPKDIVSGDFYYFDRIKNGYCFVIGDCTGHGVPGALLTMFAIKTLKEIIHNTNEFNPAKVLNKMACEVHLYLQERVSDGMDLTIAFINVEKTKIYFASANQKICRVRNGSYTVFKGDKMGIMSEIKSDYSFSNYTIDIQQGDRIFMFSDGYADQFGYKDPSLNKSSKRLMTKNFFNLLQETSHLPIDIQKKELNTFHKKWRDNKEEQTDDILVFGLEI